MKLSFDNTENAFAYKSDKELKKAKFLFSSMGYSWLVKLGTKVTPMTVQGKLPLVTSLIRNTIFKQFVGGESLEETKPAAAKLGKYHVQIIRESRGEAKAGGTKSRSRRS